MLNLICPQHCPSPFCEVACPSSAITLQVKEKNVYCDIDKCNRCGICRMACNTLSFDRTLEQRRPWVVADWATARAR